MKRLGGALLASAAMSLVAASVGAQETYEVAVIRWDPADIYFNGVQLGQEMERQRIQEEHGVQIEFRVFGANDVSAQRNALDAQLARGVDGVLLVPWRGEAMRGAAEQMREDGVPFVVSNAWIPDTEQVFVAFDNEAAGRNGGEALVRRLNELRGENWAEEGGVIIELRCIITASFDIGRHTGYRSVLDPIADAHENLTIETREAGCDGGEARRAVDDIISRYGGENVLAVASIDGTMGVGGAVPAFQAQDLLFPPDDPRHIPIATVDGTVPELQAVARGHIDHISVQPAIGEGVMTMRLLYQMMTEGVDSVPTSGAVEGDELWMPVNIVTSDVFQGPWYKTSAYSVPSDVAYDDVNAWANLMHMNTEGELPDFTE